MSSFRRRALEAWRTRGVVTYGPRLSDDPRYAAMRAGQLVHPDAHEFGMFGPVTYHGAAVDIAPLPIAEEFDRLPSPWAVPVG